MVPDPFPPSDENGESVKRYQWVVVRFASTLRRPSQSPRRPRAGIHTAAPVPRLRLPKPTYSVSTHLCLHQRSEEHTSELQSRQYLVCRLLLEKKKKQQIRGPCIHVH